MEPIGAGGGADTKYHKIQRRHLTLLTGGKKDSENKDENKHMEIWKTEIRRKHKTHCTRVIVGERATPATRRAKVEYQVEVKLGVDFL